MSDNRVPFTQYVLPWGEKRSLEIEVSADAAAMAREVIASGLSFECEILSTDEISLTAMHPDDGDVAIEIVPNGPGMREAVERLIVSARDTAVRSTYGMGEKA